jgi:hypothetical protein
MKSPAISTLVALMLAHAGTAAETFSWRKDAKSVALLSGGKVVWQFNHDPAAATKPFFHPVAVPGGEPLTWFSPADHPWHYGLWFSWKFSAEATRFATASMPPGK